MTFVLFAALLPSSSDAKDAPKSDPSAPFWSARPDTAAFRAMLEQRLARARQHLDRVRAVKGKRTLENTLRAYDDALVELDQASSQASLMENVHPDASLRAVAEQVTQKASAAYTELSLDRGIYDALSAIDLSKADATAKHYVEKTLREFRLAGVDRDEATRARVKALSEELVTIGQDFSRNIREDKRTVVAKSVDELAGMPQDFIDRHKPNADGTVTLTVEYPDAYPVFSYAKSDSLRRRMYVEFHNRAYPKNMAVLDRLVARRHELATLLGFAHWADYITANKMVGSAKNASDFIDRVVEASGARADADYQMLLQRKRKDDPKAEQVDAWQSGYYQEQVRKTDYDFDSQTLRPYYPYARVQQGVLDVTAKLFGVEFKPRTDIPVWHPSVECFEMFEDGKLVGRFYLDMHPRADKYSHAAQFDIRTGIAGRQIPEAALVCNFPGGEANDPGLMEHSDVRTFFHEFGHLVHTLFAGRQEWNGVSGIRTEHDFVEAPSQMLEEWTMDPAVLATFAKHHETNEPVPAALVRQMVRASEFGKGLMVRRQMVYARLSLSVYDRDPKQVDTDRLVKDITQRYQRIPYVDGTHLQTSFGHLEGYSAVYYTYMWSLVIAKDLFSQFDTSNLLASTTARRYRDTVLAPGGSKPAAKLVEDFLGRPFDFRAYQAWLSRDTQ